MDHTTADMLAPDAVLPDMLATKPLSLAYAERHGVLFEHNHKGTLLLCRSDTSLRVLHEAQRGAGQYCQIKRLSAEEFAQRLQAQQDTSANQTITSIDEIGDEVTLDFDRLIGELDDQPEDLLDGSEDAPIIRLLNALFTQALQYNASDLHLSLIHI